MSEVTIFLQDLLGNQSFQRLQVASNTTFYANSQVNRLFFTGSVPILSIFFTETEIYLKSPRELLFQPVNTKEKNSFIITECKGVKLMLGNTILERVETIEVEETMGEGSERTEKVCRVCYDRETEKNPLLAPCKCAGDTQFIHVECLKGWVKTQMQDSCSCTAVVLPKAAYKCEICKDEFISSKEISLRRLLGAYLDAESVYGVYKISIPQQEWMVVALKQGEEVEIGRSESADVAVWDRNVSRKHARLEQREKDVVVRDCGSKGGTWLLSSHISLSQYRHITLRLGCHRLVLKLTSLPA